MTDIRNILRLCPYNTKLYCTLTGDVTFDSVSDTGEYPIHVTAEERDLGFTKDGRYLKAYKNGECVIFPSMEERDWLTYPIPIRDGEVVAQTVTGMTYVFIFDKWSDKENLIANTHCIHYDGKEGKMSFGTRIGIFNEHIRPATEQETKSLYEELERQGKEKDFFMQI